MTITQHTRRTALVLVLVGLLTGALSRVFASGFVHGLFQGMTIALMVLAAYLFGTDLRAGRARGADDSDRDDDLWLPSKDQP